MANEQQAHERGKRLQAIMAARAAAEAQGTLSAETIRAAHKRNAELRALVESLTATSANKPRRTPRGFPGT